jgi:hypothetical protein
VADGTINPFVALDGERVVGSVLLIRSPNPNRHIAPRSPGRRPTLGPPARVRHGVDDRSRVRRPRRGRWLLVLDTGTGSAAGRSTGHGWRGPAIPDYALLTDGTLAPATWFWKDLR